MLPSAEALHLRRLRRNLFGVLSEQDLEGNRNPQGGAAEAEERAAAGRMERPEAVPEHETGYGTADTYRSKVLICIPCWRSFTAIAAAIELPRDSVRRGPVPTCFCVSLALTQTHDFRKFFGARSRIYRSQSLKHGMLL